jgi:outer membrane protein OmpA-like peptidoglycan-associated protein
MFPKLSVLSVLIPLALTGCASQKPPLSLLDADRFTTIERAAKASDEASKARDEAIERTVDALRGEVKALSGTLAEQGEQTGRLAARLDEMAARQSSLAERVTQAELRLDELATTLPERLGVVEKRLDDLSAAVKEAMVLATQENIRINGKEIFSVVLTEDKTLYPINSPELGGQDVVKLDELVARLAELGQDYHLEIQGHTDNIGTDDYNYELGKARADVVKRYLSEKKGISLNRMSVISYGASTPLDRGSNRNRRIAIRVLVLNQDR